MISLKFGRKGRFSDWVTFVNAGICFATIVTKSRRRRKQDQAQKQEQGDSDDQFGIKGWKKKTYRTKRLSPLLSPRKKCQSFPCLFSSYRYLSHRSRDTASCLTPLAMYYISKPGLTLGQARASLKQCGEKELHPHQKNCLLCFFWSL